DAGADERGRGWAVAVACPDGRLVGELADRGVHRLSWSAGRPPGPASATEVLRLRRLIAVVRPDVLHLHSSKAGLAGRLAVRGRLRTLFQPHGWSWLATSGSAATATLGWERAAARWTDVLVCVGDGDLLPSLRARTPPGVRFVGAVDDVWPWFAAADLAVLPSRWEGLPFTLLEALASGRPVVTTAVAGLHGAVPRGAGAVVPAG